MGRMYRIVRRIVFAMGLCAAATAAGQIYPAKPVRMLAPEPGGGNERQKIFPWAVAFETATQLAKEARSAVAGHP